MTRTDSMPATIAVLLSLVFVYGCAAPGDSSAQSGYASVEQIEGDPDEMVCKREKETGSRLSSRVCKTVREWEQERLDSR